MNDETEITILEYIKKNLKSSGTEYYDDEILMWINDAFARVYELNSKYDLFVATETSTWSDYSESNSWNERVKAFITLSSHINFDPPTSTTALKALEDARDKREFSIKCFNE